MRYLPMLLAMFASCASTSPGLAHADSSMGPFTLELVDASGTVLPTYRHRGRTYVLGAQGDRYQVRVRNNSSARVEAVISVDGRDVIDGKTARIGKRGYLIAPYGEVLVEGFRLSRDAVATFRFTDVADSYAARMGDARNVGVIGVAIFAERRPAPIVYRDESGRYGELGQGVESESKPAPAPRDKDAPRAAPEARDASGEEIGGTGRGNGLGARGDHEAKARDDAAHRAGLGTQFGEERYSWVDNVPFMRARPSSPEYLLELRYNDRPGLARLGIDIDGCDDTQLRESARPFGDARYSSPPPGWRSH